MHADTDGLGIASIEVSRLTVGDDQWAKLWPGFYTGKVTVEHSPYYSEASREFEIIIESPYSWELETPSLLADYIYLFDKEAVVYNGTLNDSGSIGFPAYEYNTPVLEGQVLVRNLTTVAPGNYSANIDIEDPSLDGITMTIYYNGIEMDVYDFIMPEIYNYSTSYNFSIPVSPFLANKDLNVSFEFESLNNATWKEIAITKLSFTDSPVAKRIDRDEWDILGEIIGPTALINTSVHDGLAGDAGEYELHLENGTVLNADNINITTLALGEDRSPTFAVRKDVIDVNGTTADAIVISHPDHGVNETFSTFLEFNTLLPNVSLKILDHDHFPYIRSNVTLKDGWQFEGSTADYSIRHADFNLDDNETKSGLYFPANSINPVNLAFLDQYIGYRTNMQLDVAMYNATIGESATIVLNFTSLAEPSTVTKEWTTTLQGTSSSTITSFTIPETFFTDIEGKTVDVTLSITGNCSSTGLYITSWNMTSWTTFLQVSSGIPEPLQARMFSTNFNYVYTKNATTSLGVTRNGEYDPSDPDDFKMSISGDIAEWLNIRDYSVPFDQESYQWDNWSLIKELFGETGDQLGNNETWYDLDPALNESVFAWMKWNENKKENVTIPTLVSGWFNIHDEGVIFDNLSKQLVAIISPWEWNRTSTFYRVGPNGRTSATLPSPIHMNENLTDQERERITVVYRKPGIREQDLWIDDWTEMGQVRDPLLENATGGGFENISAWFDNDTISRVFNGNIDIREMPEYWDEACISSMFEMANFSNFTEPGINAGEMNVAPDIYYGSGQVMISTIHHNYRPALTCEFPWDDLGEPADYRNFGYSMSTANETSIVEGIGIFMEVIDGGTGNIDYLCFKDSFTDAGYINALHDLSNAPVYIVDEIGSAYFFNDWSTMGDTGRRLSAGDTFGKIIFRFYLANDSFLEDYEEYSVINPQTGATVNKLLYHNCTFGLGSLYLEHEDSVATISATYSNGTIRSKTIPSSITEDNWYTSWIWDDQATLRGDLTDLEILAGNGATIDLQSISIATIDNETNDVIDQHLYHSFDSLQTHLMNLSYTLGEPGMTAPFVWNTTGNVTTNATDIWVIDQGWDFDLDGSMDMFVQQLSLDGSGNFTDGIEDLVKLDANGNGRWEVQIHENTIVSPRLSDENTWVHESLQLLTTVAVDADENGIAEEKTTDWMQIISNPLSGDEYITWNGTNFTTPEFEYRSDNWQFGYEDSADYDQDGSPDHVVKARDRFDDPGLLGGRTYDDVTTIEYSWYWDDNASIWKRNSTMSHENTLTKNMTFELLGAGTTITGEFIVLDGVKVMIDPRDILGESDLRLDENGTLLFYDSNNDGRYELAFVMTEKTRWMEIPQAIGIMIDENLNGKCDVSWRGAIDTYIPTSWMDPGAGFETITGLAHNDAWNSYVDQISSPMFIASTILDTIVMAFVFALVSAATGMISTGIATWAASVGAGSAAGPIGTAAGLILGAAIMAATMFAYQEYLKQLMNIPLEMLIQDETPDQGVNIIGDDKQFGDTAISLVGGDQVKYYWVGSTASGNDNPTATDWYNHQVATNLHLPDAWYTTVDSETTEQWLSWLIPMGVEWVTSASIEHVELEYRRSMLGHFVNETLPDSMLAVSAATSGKLGAVVPTIDMQGRPSLVLVDERVPTVLNTSDPVAFNATMGIVGYSALYQAAVNHYSEADWAINLVQIGINIGQIVASVYLGRTFGTFLVSNPAAVSLAAGEFAKEIVQELIYEQIAKSVSMSVFSAMGHDENDPMPLLSALTWDGEFTYGDAAEIIGEIAVGLGESYQSAKLGAIQGVANHILSKATSMHESGQSISTENIEMFNPAAIFMAAHKAKSIEGAGVDVSNAIIDAAKGSQKVMDKRVKQLINKKTKVLASEFPAGLRELVKQHQDGLRGVVKDVVSSLSAEGALFSSDADAMFFIQEEVLDYLESVQPGARDMMAGRTVDLLVTSWNGKTTRVNVNNPVPVDTLLTTAMKVKIGDVAARLTRLDVFKRFAEEVIRGEIKSDEALVKYRTAIIEEVLLEPITETANLYENLNELLDKAEQAGKMQSIYDMLTRADLGEMIDLYGQTVDFRNLVRLQLEGLPVEARAKQNLREDYVETLKLSDSLEDADYRLWVERRRLYQELSRIHFDGIKNLYNLEVNQMNTRELMRLVEYAKVNPNFVNLNHKMRKSGAGNVAIIRIQLNGEIINFAALSGENWIGHDATNEIIETLKLSNNEPFETTKRNYIANAKPLFDMELFFGWKHSTHSETQIINIVYNQIRKLNDDGNIESIGDHLYIHSPLVFCDGCMLDMLELYLGMKHFGLDTDIIATFDREVSESSQKFFPRFIQKNPATRDAIQGAFITHAESLYGNFVQQQGIQKLIDDYFNALLAGNVQGALHLLRNAD